MYKPLKTLNSSYKTPVAAGSTGPQTWKNVTWEHGRTAAGITCSWGFLWQSSVRTVLLPRLLVTLGQGSLEGAHYYDAPIVGSFPMEGWMWEHCRSYTRGSCGRGDWDEHMAKNQKRFQVPEGIPPLNKKWDYVKVFFEEIRVWD
jgi:hypothetical protein